MKSINILVSGVGGQGVILISDILAQVGMDKGYDVKKSDSLGMARRGGSVYSHIRWSEHVYSPMVKLGEADFLLATEQLEAARWAPYLRSDGIVVFADVIMAPAYVKGLDTRYPSLQEVEEILCQYTSRVFPLAAEKITRQLGNPRALNMVLLGFLSTFLDVASAEWTSNIRTHLPERFAELSIAAFERGIDEAASLNPKI